MALTAAQQKAYNAIMAGKAMETVIRGQMELDSTDPTILSAETNMENDEGWEIYGFQYWWENDSSKLPQPIGQTSQTVGWRVEICRDDNNNLDALIGPEDDRCLGFHDVVCWDHATPIGGPWLQYFPIPFGYPLVTTAKHLTAIMESTVDLANISTAGIYFCCRVLYNVVVAPNEVDKKAR